MCDPLTMAISSFAIGAAQTISEYSAAQEQADQQNEMVRVNQRNANNALVKEYQATQTRQIQEEDAAAIQKQDVARQARAARATTMAAAGEAGVSGLSVDALLADIYGKEATTKDRVTQNTGFTVQNLTSEMDGFKAKAQDRINSMPWANQPSPFAAALKIGGSGLNSLSLYNKLKS